MVPSASYESVSQPRRHVVRYSFQAKLKVNISKLKQKERQMLTYFYTVKKVSELLCPFVYSDDFNAIHQPVVFVI